MEGNEEGINEEKEVNMDGIKEEREERTNETWREKMRGRKRRRELRSNKEGEERMNVINMERINSFFSYLHFVLLDS